MFLKPRSSTLNPRALLYKRFIGLEESQNLKTMYVTSDSKIWLFDYATLTFNDIPNTLIPPGAKLITIPSTHTVLSYLNTYFRYYPYTASWGVIDPKIEPGLTILSATFNNIGKYQMNKYYYVGSFDFMIKGSIEGSTAQYVKGLITPLSSMNIRTFNDDVILSPDDLCVVYGKLYAIENLELSQKRMPKPFNIYFATLNNIL